MVEPGAPGQIPKEKATRVSKGVPKGSGVPKSKGIPIGDGTPSDQGRRPGATGQISRGAPGQVDRGAPGQMDKDAENPWSTDDPEERPPAPEAPGED